MMIFDVEMTTRTMHGQSKWSLKYNFPHRSCRRSLPRCRIAPAKWRNCGEIMQFMKYKDGTYEITSNDTQELSPQANWSKPHKFLLIVVVVVASEL